MSDAKLYAWQEGTQPNGGQRQRTFNTGNGLVTVTTGDHVMIVVAKRWSELANVIAQLDPGLVATDEEP